jgi:UDP-2,3-diacylglucosamine pyrophosphatase LpxH
MSKEDIAVDWDKLWDEYNQAVKAWMSVFETFQKATTYFQTSCNDLMAKSSKESNIYPMNQFIENWQNVFNKPAMEQLKRYGDLMKKFSEDYSWYEMWNKNMMTNTKKEKIIPVLKSKKVRKSLARKSKKNRTSLAQKSKKSGKSPARRFKKTSR